MLPLMLLLCASMIAAGKPAPRAHLPAPSPAPALASPPALAPLAPTPEQAGQVCMTALLNLYSCLTYVEQGSNVSVPEKGCCPSLAALVASQPNCLCNLLSNSSVFGVKIDNTKALKLPIVCRVRTPPVSLCSVLGIPVPSPLTVAPVGAAGQHAGPLAPAPQIKAPPNRAGEGLTAGVTAVWALVAVGSQALTAVF